MVKSTQINVEAVRTRLKRIKVEIRKPSYMEFLEIPFNPPEFYTYNAIQELKAKCRRKLIKRRGK